MAGAALRCGLCLLVATCAGCGCATSTITGKVTHKGKPVLSGAIIFLDSEGITRTSVIQPDGTYTIEQVSRGINKIAITSPDPAKARSILGSSRKSKDRQATNSPTRESWFPLPASIGDPDKSGLTFDVTSSNMHFDIDIP